MSCSKPHRRPRLSSRLSTLPRARAVLRCENRSQARNREIAIELVKAKLMLLAEEQRAATVAEIKARPRALPPARPPSHRFLGFLFWSQAPAA